MVMTKVKSLCAFVISGVLLVPPEVLSSVIAHSEISYHDVGITPTAGSVLFTGPWILEAQAGADNSLGEIDSRYADVVGPGLAAASDAVTWASSSGDTADPEPTPPYLDITGSGVADGDITGQTNASAESFGLSTVSRDDPFLPSYFEITGGEPGGPVSVTFSVLIDYALSVTTDQYGVLAEAEAIFSQELFGDDVGFVLFNTFDQLLSIGPNEHQEDANTNRLLSYTLDLQYGTLYTLLLEADAEARVVNANVPEPAIQWLMALTLPVLYRATRRGRDAPNQV